MFSMFGNLCAAPPLSCQVHSFAVIHGHNPNSSKCTTHQKTSTQTERLFKDVKLSTNSTIQTTNRDQALHKELCMSLFLPHLDVFTRVGMALRLTPNSSSSFLKPMRNLRISCVACQMLTMILTRLQKHHQLTEQAGCKLN